MQDAVTGHVHDSADFCTALAGSSINAAEKYEADQHGADHGLQSVAVQVDQCGVAVRSGAVQANQCRAAQPFQSGAIQVDHCGAAQTGHDEQIKKDQSVEVCI